MLNFVENFRQVIRYGFERRKLSDVDSNDSILVQSEQGVTYRSTLSSELTYDTRDSRFDTREGYVVRLQNEVAGLGGDVFYASNRLGGSYYYTVEDDWTFSVRAEVGNITGLGEDTRVSDRFFFGGNNPRGFEFAGIGPRDATTSDALGGKNFYTGTLEMSFPSGLPEDLDVRGRAFVDVASVWDIDGGGVVLNDSSDPRVTVGVGMSWNSPFGPVIVDLGFAVVKEDFDETELLSFSFGTQF